MRKRARFDVSEELLIQALNMPEGTVIVDLYRNNTRGLVHYEFFVEHDDLEPVQEAEVLPRLCPIITLDYDDLVPRQTFDWGIKGNNNGN